LQQISQASPPLPAFLFLHGKPQGLWITDKYDEFTGSCDACVNEASFEHNKLLGAQRNDHARELATLALMDGHGVGRLQGV
jgi:hypothetical protein